MTKTTTHTQGPQGREGGGPPWAIDQGKPICQECEGVPGWHGDAGYHAGYVRLCPYHAAAPELLAVAVELKRYAWANNPDGLSLELRAIINRAAEAIARAEGR